MAMTTEREIGRLRRAAGIAGGASAPQVALPDGIVQFATDPHFLGVDLFPRQGTLLKMMTLDFESFTDFDFSVVDNWASGFVLDGEGSELAFRGDRGTTPDVSNRMTWCRDAGYPWFREMVLVLGRRASKSFLVSIMVAWRVWRLLALKDPQAHYQMPPLKTLLIEVFGTDQAAVRRDAYGDVERLLSSAACFKPFLGAQTSTSISLLTPSQLEAGARSRVDEGSIQIAAVASTSTAGRGPAVPMLWFDESAHALGAGSTADSVDLYGSASPATAQFPDALIVHSSTPWETSGQLYVSYQEALEVNPQTRTATRPEVLVVQLESPALYLDYERAGKIPMWPSGPCYRQGLKPKITYEFIEKKMATDPVTARVEWYAQFGTVVNPYLLLDRVAACFTPHQGQVLEQETRGKLGNYYVGHADPSKSNANFGFAIGHLEDDRGPHVFIDVLRSWNPDQFSGGIIDYLEVNEEIYSDVKKFLLRTLTFDQYSSTQTIQDLQRRARLEGLWWRPQIYERTATASQNQSAYELFKTVVNAGLLHMPPHALARAELEHLTVKGDRVVAPASGPVRTKDLADAIVNVVWTLLHERTDEVFAALAGLPPSGSQPGGLPLAGTPQYELSNFGKRAAFRARQSRYRGAGR